MSHQNSYVEALIPYVIIIRDEAVERLLGLNEVMRVGRRSVPL